MKISTKKLNTKTKDIEFMRRQEHALREEIKKIKAEIKALGPTPAQREARVKNVARAREVVADRKRIDKIICRAKPETNES